MRAAHESRGGIEPGNNSASGVAFARLHFTPAALGHLAVPMGGNTMGAAEGAVVGYSANLLDLPPTPPFGYRKMTQSSDLKADATLDATGLLCPLPVLKARRALKPLAPGAVLDVLATDPGAVKDFEHFCQTTGCELLDMSEEPGGVLRFRMRKPG